MSSISVSAKDREGLDVGQSPGTTSPGQDVVVGLERPFSSDTLYVPEQGEEMRNAIGSKDSVEDQGEDDGKEGAVDGVVADVVPRSKTYIPKAERRYWNGRLSRKQYVYLVTFLGFALFFIVAAVLLYNVVLRILLPKQLYFYLFEASWAGLIIKDFTFYGMNPDGFSTRLIMQSRVLQLPVRFAYGELQPASYTFYTKNNKRKIFVMDLNNPLNLNGWETLKFNLDPFTIRVPDPENAADVLSKVMKLAVGANKTEEHFDIYIEAHADIWVCGFPIYNINMYREQRVTFKGLYNFIGRNLFGNLNTLLTQDTFRSYLGSIGGIAISANGTEITKMQQQQQIEEEPTRFTALSLNLNNTGVHVRTQGKFGGNLTTTLNSGTVTFHTKLNQAVFAKIQISGIDLKRNDPDFDIHFLATPTIEGDRDALRDGIKAIASGKFLGVTAGLNGFQINGANEERFEWLDTFLSKIDFDLDIESFQKQFFSVSNPGGFASTIGESTLFKGLKVRVLQNQTIEIEPKISIDDHFKADIDVAAFQAHMLANDGIPLASIDVPAIQLNEINRREQSPVLIIKLFSNPEATESASAMMRALAFNGDAYLGFGNIVFVDQLAQNGQIDYVNGISALFHVMKLQVPLQVLAWGQLDPKDPEPLFGIAPANLLASTDKLITNEGPIIAISDSEPILDADLQGVGLEIVRNGLKVMLAANAKTRFPVSVTVPYLELKLQMEYSDALWNVTTLSLTDVSLSDAMQLVSIGAGVEFGTDKGLPKALHGFVRQLFEEDVVASGFLVIERARIGFSKDDSSTLLDKINLKVPAPIIAQGLVMLQEPTMPPVDPTRPKHASPVRFAVKGNTTFDMKDLIPQISSAAVSTAPETLAVGLGVGWSNLPVNLSIPFASASLQLNNETMVDVTLANFSVSQGLAISPAQIRAKFNNQDTMQSKVSEWIDQLVNGQGSIKTAISGLAFGESPSESVQAFSDFSIPIDKNPKKSPSSPSSSKGLDLSVADVFPALSTFKFEDSEANIAKIDIETLPSATLGLATDVSFNNRLPILVDVPFAQVVLGLDGTPAVTVTVNGLLVKDGKQVLSLGVQGAFSSDPSLPLKVKELVDGALAGKGLVSDLMLQGIQVGPSLADSIRTFAKVNVPLPSSSSSASSGSSLDIGSIAPWANDLSASSFAFNPKQIAISTISGGFNVLLDASLENPTPISVKIGYAGVQALLEENLWLVDTSISGLSLVSKSNALNAELALAINQDSAVPPRVTQLIQDVVAKKPISFLIGGIKVGVDANDRIDAFSLVTIPISVPTDLSSGGSSLAISAESLGIGVQNLEVSTISGGFDVSAAIDFTNPTPVSVDIGYVSGAVKFDDSLLLLEASLGNLKVGNGKNGLSASLRLMINQDDQVPIRVGQVVEKIISGNDVEDLSLSVGSFKIGVSSTDFLNTFTEVSVPVNLPLSSVGSLSLGNSGMPSLGFDVKEAALTTISGGFDAALSASLALPFPVKLNIGYLSGRVFFGDGTWFLDASLSSLSIGSTDSIINANIRAMINQEEPVPTLVNDLVQDMINKRDISLSIGEFKIGVSPSDYLNTFTRISVPLSLPTSGLFLPSLEGSSPAVPVDFSMQSITVSTVSGGFEAAIESSLSLPFPLRINVGFLSTRILHSTGLWLMDASIGSLSLVPGTSKLSAKVHKILFSLQISIQVNQEAAVPLAIGDIVSQITEKKNDISLAIGHFKVGVTPSDYLNTFTRITVPIEIPVARLISGTSNSSVSLAPMDAFSLDRLALSTVSGGFKADVSLSLGLTLPFSVKASLGHVSTRFLLNKNVWVAQASLDNLVASLTDGSRISATVPLSLTQIHVMLNQDDKVPISVSQFVEQIIQGSNEISFSLQDLRVGVSSEEFLNTFTAIKIPVVVPVTSSLLSSSSVDGSISTPGFLESSQLDVTVVDGGFEVGVALPLSTPETVSIDIGYLSAKLLVKDTWLLQAALEGIAISKATDRLVAKVLLFDVCLHDKILLIVNQDAAVPPLVAESVDNLLSEKTLPSLSVNDIRVGVSQDETLNTFSLVEIPLNQFIPALPSTAALELPSNLTMDILKSAAIATVKEGISASFEVELPFSLPVSVNVGYFAAQLLLPDGSVLCEASINNLVLSQQERSLASNVISSGSYHEVMVKLNDVGNQDQVSQWVTSILDNKQVLLSIGRIKVGVTPEKYLNTLEAIKFTRSIPLSMPTMDGSLSLLSVEETLKVNDLSVQTVPFGLSVTGGISFLNPLPISLNIGHIQLDIGLVSHPWLVSLSLNDLVLSAGSNDLRFNVRAIFNQDDSAGSGIVQSIQEYIGGKPLALTIGSLVVGESEENYWTTFNKVSVPINVPTIGDTTSIGSSFNVSDLVSLDNVALSTISGGFSVSLEATLNAALPVSLNIGYLSAALSSTDDLWLVKAVVQELSVSSGSRAIKTEAQLLFNRDDVRVPDRFTDLVDEILAGSPSQVKVNHFVFGTSHETLVKTFGQIQVPITIPPLSMSSSLIHGSSSSYSMLTEYLEMSQVALVAIPKGFSARLGASLTIPFGLSAKFGHISLGIGLKKEAPIAVVTVNDLAVSAGKNALSLETQIVFNQDTSLLLSSMINEIMNGNQIALNFGQFKFGATEQDTVDVLSKINVPLALPVQLPLSTGNSSLPSNLFSMRQGHFELVPTGAQFDLAVDVALPFPIILDIGVLSVEVLLENVLFATARISELHLEQNQPLQTRISLEFGTDASLPDKVRQVIDKFLKHEAFDVTLARLTVGPSEAELFELVSSVSASQISTLSSSSLGNSTSADIQIPGIKSIERLGIKTTEPGMDIAFAGTIRNPLSVSAKIGFVSIELFHHENMDRLVKLELENLILSEGDNQIQVLVKTELGGKPSAARDILDVWNAFQSGNALDLRVGSAFFGSSRDAKLSVFSKVRLALPEFNVNNLMLSHGSSNSSLVLYPSPTSVDISTTETGLRGMVGLKWSGFPFPVSIDIGYVSTTIFIDGVKLSEIHVKNLVIAEGDSTQLSIPIDIDLVPEDPLIAEKVAAIVNPLLQGQEMGPLVLSLGDLYFGIDEMHKNDVFSLIKAPVPLLGPSSGSTGSTVAGLTATETVQSIHFESTRNGLLLNVKASIPIPPLPVPVRAYIGLVKADLLVLQTRFLSVSLKDIRFNGETSLDLDIPIAIDLLPEDAELAPRLGQFVNDFLEGSVEDISLGVSGLVLGHSLPSQTFNVLSKVKYEKSLSIYELLEKIYPSSFSALSIPSGSMPSMLSESIGNFLNSGSFAILDNGVISASVNASLSLGVPVTGSLGYVGASVSYNTHLATAAIKDIRILDNSISASFELDFARSDEAAENFALLFKSVWESMVFVQLSGLKFGFDQENAFMGLSKINAPLPVGPLSLPSGSRSLQVANGRSVEESRLPSWLQDSDLTIEVVSTGIKGALVFKLPHNSHFSIDLGFIQATLGTSLTGDLGTVSVSDLLVSQYDPAGPATIDISIPVNQQKVAHLVQSLMNGTLPSIEISGFLVGKTPQSALKIFSKIKQNLLVPRMNQSSISFNFEDNDFYTVTSKRHYFAKNNILFADARYVFNNTVLVHIPVKFKVGRIIGHVMTPNKMSFVKIDLLSQFAKGLNDILLELRLTSSTTVATSQLMMLYYNECRKELACLVKFLSVGKLEMRGTDGKPVAWFTDSLKDVLFPLASLEPMVRDFLSKVMPNLGLIGSAHEFITNAPKNTVEGIKSIWNSLTGGKSNNGTSGFRSWFSGNTNSSVSTLNPLDEQSMNANETAQVPAETETVEQGDVAETSPTPEEKDFLSSLILTMM